MSLSEAPTAAVVVLNWNRAALTRACLAAARAATAQKVRWIVVDNGSAEPFVAESPDVDVICNATNLGYAGGVNVGLRHAFAAGATHAWLLNNDAVPVAGALDRMLEAARADPGIGLASPVVLNADDGDAVEFFAGRWMGGIFTQTTEPAEHAAWSREHPERIWLLGTALLVSKALADRIGPFDERLFAYWEDNDISVRSARAGFRNVVVPDAFVRHHAGRRVESPGDLPPYYYYYMARNELVVLRKMRAPPRALYWAVMRQVRLHRRLRGLAPQRRAVRAGLLHAVLGRGGQWRGQRAGAPGRSLAPES